MSTQRTSAFARANEIRSARSRVKRELTEGQRSFRAALSDPYVQSMRTYSLLLALHRFGPEKTRKALREAGILESARVERLTERQREKLVEVVG